MNLKMKLFRSKMFLPLLFTFTSMSERERRPYGSDGSTTRMVEHGPFYRGGGKSTIYTREIVNPDGSYGGAEPDPEHGAPYGWEVVNGELRAVDPFR